MRWIPRILIEQRLRIIVLAVPMVAALAAAPLMLGTAQADGPDDGRSLMQTLAKWKYPGSTMLDGASMSDGGNRLVASVKCKAILITPDPIEKVIAFYSDKLAAKPAAALQEQKKAEVNDADARAVTTEDDSQGRPVTVKVIVVNTVDTSTTLVISRGTGEKETHIAWLHYIRLDAEQAPLAR